MYETSSSPFRFCLVPTQRCFLADYSRLGLDWCRFLSLWENFRETSRQENVSCPRRGRGVGVSRYGLTPGPEDQVGDPSPETGPGSRQDSTPSSEGSTCPLDSDVDRRLLCSAVSCPFRTGTLASPDATVQVSPREPVPSRRLSCDHSQSSALTTSREVSSTTPGVCEPTTGVPGTPPSSATVKLVRSLLLIPHRRTRLSPKLGLVSKSGKPLVPGENLRYLKKGSFYVHTCVYVIKSLLKFSKDLGDLRYLRYPYT